MRNDKRLLSGAVEDFQRCLMNVTLTQMSSGSLAVRKCFITQRDQGGRDGERESDWANNTQISRCCNL